jgi:hypothetical protein
VSIRPIFGALILAALILATPTAALAQRDSDIDGAEICRPIWREYGRNSSGRPSAVYCEVREIGTMPARSLIDVEGDEHNGATIIGSGRTDVRVRLVIQAQGETVADARDIARQVSIDMTRTPLRAETPSLSEWRRSGRRHVSALIVVDVPVASNVSARVNYAPLEIENVRGKVDARVEYGPLTLRDVSGDVRARSDHGPVSVHVSGSRWEGAGLDAVAQYGPMTLSVPRDFNAELEIGAEHGPLQVDIPLTLSRFDRASIRTRMGAGGPRVRAVAEYGPMSLRENRGSDRR